MSRFSVASAFGLVMLLLSTFFAAGRATAQTKPSGKAADVLFREARRLMEAKDYAAACPMLQESQRIDPSPATLLNLGECYEKSGQPLKAWSTFKEAAHAAAARDRSDWLNAANAHAETLEAKLPMLTIAVDTKAADIPSFKVERDGVAAPPSSWGIPTPVEAGTHTVTASAPGRLPWTLSVDVPPSKKIVATVPVLARDPNAPSDETRLLTEAGVTTPDGPREPKSPSDTMRILGYVLTGVGVVGLGVGGFTGLRAIGLRSDAADMCESYPDRCGPGAASTNGEAQSFATVSTISIVAGAVLLAGGIVLLVTSPSKPRPAN